MRVRWSQRRAWAIWIFASLAGWVAIVALFTFGYTQVEQMIAGDADQSAPADIAPASGPNSQK